MIRKSGNVEDFWWYLWKDYVCYEQETCSLDMNRWYRDIGIAREFPDNRHTEQQWADRFRLVDLNNDGRIDYDEFDTWFAGGWQPYSGRTDGLASLKYYEGAWAHLTGAVNPPEAPVPFHMYFDILRYVTLC